MGKVASLNYELQVRGKTLYPTITPEFGVNEEGTIEVVDGDVKYPIRDGIVKTEALEFVFNQKDEDNEDIEIMDNWVTDKSKEDAFLIGRDAGQNVVQNYYFEECEAIGGKNSGNDNKSKAESTRKYMLLPKKINPVT